MTTELTIEQQYARGEFAYWSAETEASWRANAPSEKPAPPAIESMRNGWKQRVPVDVRAHSYHPAQADDDYDKWDVAIAQGRSYLVGSEVPMPEFIRTHRSALIGWQKEAYRWARSNPFYKLGFKIGNNEWEVYQRGEYVTFGLPHQDAGGEKHYISHDGRSKILVNVD